MCGFSGGESAVHGSFSFKKMKCLDQLFEVLTKSQNVSNLSYICTNEDNVKTELEIKRKTHTVKVLLNLKLSCLKVNANVWNM